MVYLRDEQWQTWMSAKPSLASASVCPAAHRISAMLAVPRCRPCRVIEPPRRPAQYVGGATAAAGGTRANRFCCGGCTVGFDRRAASRVPSRIPGRRSQAAPATELGGRHSRLAGSPRDSHCEARTTLLAWPPATDGHRVPCCTALSRLPVLTCARSTSRGSAAYVLTQLRELVTNSSSRLYQDGRATSSLDPFYFNQLADPVSRSSGALAAGAFHRRSLTAWQRAPWPSGFTPPWWRPCVCSSSSLLCERVYGECLAPAAQPEAAQAAWEQRKRAAG